MLIPRLLLIVVIVAATTQKIVPFETSVSSPANFLASNWAETSQGLFGFDANTGTLSKLLNKDGSVSTATMNWATVGAKVPSILNSRFGTYLACDLLSSKCAVATDDKVLLINSDTMTSIRTFVNSTVAPSLSQKRSTQLAWVQNTNYFIAAGYSEDPFYRFDSETGNYGIWGKIETTVPTNTMSLSGILVVDQTKWMVISGNGGFAIYDFTNHRDTPTISRNRQVRNVHHLVNLWQESETKTRFAGIEEYEVVVFDVVTGSQSARYGRAQSELRKQISGDFLGDIALANYPDSNFLLVSKYSVRRNFPSVRHYILELVGGALISRKETQDSATLDTNYLTSKWNMPYIATAFFYKSTSKMLISIKGTIFEVGWREDTITADRQNQLCNPQCYDCYSLFNPKCLEAPTTSQVIRCKVTAKAVNNVCVAQSKTPYGAWYDDMVMVNELKAGTSGYIVDIDRKQQQLTIPDFSDYVAKTQKNRWARWTVVGTLITIAVIAIAAYIFIKRRNHNKRYQETKDKSQEESRIESIKLEESQLSDRQCRK